MRSRIKATLYSDTKGGGGLLKRSPKCSLKWTPFLYSGAAEWFVLKKKLLLQKVLDVDVFELALCELVAHRHIHQAKPLGGKQRPTAEPLLSPLHHHLPSFQHCHHTFPSIVDKTKSRHISLSVYLYPYQHITFWWRVPIEKVQAICWKKYTSSQIVLSRASVPGARNNKFVTET